MRPLILASVLLLLAPETALQATAKPTGGGSARGALGGGDGAPGSGTGVPGSLDRLEVTPAMMRAIDMLDRQHRTIRATGHLTPAARRAIEIIAVEHRRMRHR